jgi:hypothetical protein
MRSPRADPGAVPRRSDDFVPTPARSYGRVSSLTAARRAGARSASRLRRGPRGQAMVEYSIIAHALLIGGTLLLLPVITTLLDALTTFYDSVYAILQTAAL